MAVLARLAVHGSLTRILALVFLFVFFFGFFFRILVDSSQGRRAPLSWALGLRPPGRPNARLKGR